MTKKATFRLINNKKETLVLSRQYTKKARAKIIGIMNARLRNFLRIDAVKRTFDEISRFAFWINLASVGFIFSMLISASQLFHYKDCESYYTSSIYIKDMLAALGLYVNLLMWPAIPVGLGMIMTLIMASSIYLWPSRKNYFVRHPEISERWAGIVKNLTVYLSVMSIFAWAYIFTEIFPLFVSAYSVDAAVQFHEIASMKCAIIESGMKQRMSFPRSSL
ncbi:hypothetical protein GBZ48_31765 [Azospirillum melinis]|uniref:Uncharacterized protein n=1 Tax=Azospirillum melinis TaxID=328839 RepID=A0ABX2KMA1_9PROT|nr:hypothetical protein [Azospirillum melinis]MBP2305173.1 hypothetical protein [Azospirillum melinis]NUB03793.1 hypothetical protein [Azospirillum melinis]